MSDANTMVQGAGAAGGTADAVQQATVTYTFKENSLVVTVIVSTTAAEYTASDGKSVFPGFAIMDGSGGQYVDSQKNKRSFVIPAKVRPDGHNGAPFNILWALSGAGIKGSVNGLDTFGVVATPDNGQLCWNGGADRTSFYINVNNGNLNSNVTLVSTHGWPPRS